MKKFFYILALIKYKHYALMVVFQGSTLFTWIIVQMIMLRTFHYLHAIFNGIGILQVLAGVMFYYRK